MSRRKTICSVEPLTRRAAAEQLGVTPARISQLLASGQLRGPAQAAGRRAPKNAPRVWRESLEAYARERRGGGRQGIAAAGEMSNLALRDDLLRLKYALDQSREQVSKERAQTARVTALLAEAVEALRHEQETASVSEQVIESLSTIWTTHLFPDTPPS